MKIVSFRANFFRPPSKMPSRTPMAVVIISPTLLGPVLVWSHWSNQRLLKTVRYFATSWGQDHRRSQGGLRAFCQHPKFCWHIFGLATVLVRAGYTFTLSSLEPRASKSKGASRQLCQLQTQDVFEKIFVNNLCRNYS